MIESKPKILITFREDGKNGGPYISHKRIMESSLSNKYNFEAFYIPNPRKLRNPKVFFKVIKQIKKAKPDIVHIAGLQTEGFLMMLIAKLARVKTIVAVHGSSTEALGYSKLANFVFKTIEKYTVKSADAVYGVSDYVSSWQICKKAKRYCGTVYNIADLTEKILENEDIRKEIGITDTDVVVASTGRIIKDKGFDVLLQIAKDFKENKNVKFVVAGDGVYKQEMQEEIEKENLKNVHLLGYRKDIGNVLKGSDIFVICTKHETLCISLLEAAVYSLPLVASDVGGIPEIIEDGKNGFLIKVGNVQAFKEAILKLVTDKTLRKQMGDNACASIKHKFDKNKITDKLDKIYSSVLQK